MPSLRHGLIILLSLTSTIARPLCRMKSSSKLTTSSSSNSTSNSTDGGAAVITSATLLALPSVSNTCSSSQQFPDECRTADQAAAPIDNSFKQYNVSTKGEMAALLGLMVFESGGFAWDKNHFPAPGRPGQGTRNMMEFEDVLKYALDINSTTSSNSSSVSAQTMSLLGNISPSDPDSVSDSTQNQILALLLADDNLSFGSAAWYLRTRCDQSVSDGLKTGSESAWETFTSNCVGTDVTDDRKQAWQSAVTALGA